MPSLAAIFVAFHALCVPAAAMATPASLSQCQNNPRLKRALLKYAESSKHWSDRKRWLVYTCNCKPDAAAYNTDHGFHACFDHFRISQINTYTPKNRPGCSCGGLGDRYNGALSGLVVAMLTGRAFAVDWASPCDLQNYFHAPFIPWHLREQWQRLERGVDSEDGVVNTGCLSLIDYPPEAEFFSSQNITSIIQKHRIVRLLTNVNMLEPLSKSMMHADQMAELGLVGSSILTHNFACLFEFLFGGEVHKTPMVESEVSRVLSHRVGARPLIGVQIRLGGVWDTSLMEVANDPSMWVDAVAWSLSLEGMQDALIFLTSDREPEVLALLREIYGDERVLYNEAVEENVHLDHVDNRDDSACGTHTAIAKAFIDHHILSFHCDILLISMSGYGATAVWRSKHNRTFVVEPGAIPHLPKKYDWRRDNQTRESLGDDGRRVIQVSGSG